MRGVTASAAASAGTNPAQIRGCAGAGTRPAPEMCHVKPTYAPLNAPYRRPLRPTGAPWSGPARQPERTRRSPPTLRRGAARAYDLIRLTGFSICLRVSPIVIGRKRGVARPMAARKGGAGSPTFDQDLADSYLGKYILVGITYVDHAGKELRREQLHGVIQRASPDGIFLSLRGAHEGESWNMPPLLQAISHAKPGTYTLSGTGEDIENPDLVATWEVRAPQKH